MLFSLPFRKLGLRRPGPHALFLAVPENGAAPPPAPMYRPVHTCTRCEANSIGMNMPFVRLLGRARGLATA